MDEKIISNPEENPFSIEVKNFDTDKTKWEIQKGVVNPPKELPLPDELGELKFILKNLNKTYSLLYNLIEEEH